MNTLFDFLNHVGQRFEAVAEPLFWQSTLLIALVWLADRGVAQ